MRKFWAALGSAVFFVIAPGTVAGFLPWAISRGEMQPALFGQDWLRIVGGVLVFLGLVPLLNSFLRRARRARHARPDRADAAPCGHGVLSPRAQPDVCRFKGQNVGTG